MDEMIKILKEVIEAERKFFRATYKCAYVNPLRDITDTSIGEKYHGCRHPKVNEIASCRPDRCPLRGMVF
ncbi:MAG: hypothetical protein ACTSX1_11350 [Candidatus Heimdallarchaeaceae archaeon]